MIKDPDPDLYLVLSDPDGPKRNGFYATIIITKNYHLSTDRFKMKINFKKSVIIIYHSESSQLQLSLTLM
jgi:hypothetical protein